MESEVNFSYYIGHYFSMPECGIFFALSLGVLFVLFVALYIYTLINSTKYKKEDRKEYIRIEWHVLVERYYELVFSGTSILFFMAVYYLIDRFITVEPLRSTWEKYDDFILLALIIFSCMLNSFLDRIFVRLKFLSRDEKSGGRLTGMFYMILIFCYIKFIYENDNYDRLITYFITLMVGRFAYFDSTIHDFLKAMKGVVSNIGILIFTLLYLSIMSLYGFKSDYLLTHNGVITNVFITHLFMCASIFVLYHIHIAELVTGRGGREIKPKVQKQVREEYAHEEEQDAFEMDTEYYEENSDYRNQQIPRHEKSSVRVPGASGMGELEIWDLDDMYDDYSEYDNYE